MSARLDKLDSRVESLKKSIVGKQVENIELSVGVPDEPHIIIDSITIGGRKYIIHDFDEQGCAFKEAVNESSIKLKL